MNKRKLHHKLTLLRKIHLTVLILLFLGAAASAVFALRANNQQMVVLRASVFEADKKDGDTESALRNLREYVYAHMNTNLSSGANSVKPPIQLKYEYDRLVAAEKKRFDKETQKVGAAARKSCNASSAVNTSLFPCIQRYVNSHSTTVKPIEEDKYKFDFISPFWSPDFAGWSLVAAGVLLLLIVFRVISGAFIRFELKRES